MRQQVLSVECPNCKMQALQERLYDKVEVTCYNCGYQSYESIILEIVKPKQNYCVVNVVVDKDRGIGQTILCEDEQQLNTVVAELKKTDHNYIYMTRFEDGQLKKIDLST